MKRLALIVTVLAGLAGQAHAAPGDAELAAWYARWTDSDGRLTMEYEPGVLNSWFKYDRICKGELHFIKTLYPGSPAANRADFLLNILWVMPRGMSKPATP